MTCKDVIAQQYLMECVILVFPDEYHLNTLDRLLQTCALLQPGVNIKSIIVGLIDRLANFAQNESIPSHIQLFNFFYDNLVHVFNVCFSFHFFIQISTYTPLIIITFY